MKALVTTLQPDDDVFTKISSECVHLLLINFEMKTSRPSYSLDFTSWLLSSYFFRNSIWNCRVHRVLEKLFCVLPDALFNI